MSLSNTTPGICTEEEAESDDRGLEGNRVFQTNRTDTHVDSQTVTACAEPAQVQVKQKGEEDMEPNL